MQLVVVVLKAIKVCKGGTTRIVESGSATVRMMRSKSMPLLSCCNRAEPLVP